MLTFHIVEILVRLFPDPSGPLASFAGDLFEILGCYFPIHFTHVSQTYRLQVCCIFSYFSAFDSLALAIFQQFQAASRVSLRIALCLSVKNMYLEFLWPPMKMISDACELCFWVGCPNLGCFLV